MDKRINGKAMYFQKAYLQIGKDKYYKDISFSAQSASFEVFVDKGETSLTTYFDMENGLESNAFYVYIKKLNK